MCIIRSAQIAEAMQAEGKPVLKFLFKFNQLCVDNLIKIVNNRGLRLGGYSSAGRALAWHARGQRFDPAYLHQSTQF